MGYGGGAGAAAEQARADEQRRKKNIDTSFARIDSTFDGTHGTNKATQYDPKAKYYDEFGKEWQPDLGDIQAQYAKSGPPTTFSGKSFDRPPNQKPTQSFDAFLNDRKAMAYQEAIAGGNLYTGSETSGGFDDKFYNQKAQDYQDYALPQLADQEKAQSGQITAGLARRGLLDSEAAIRAKTNLQKYVGTKKRDIADAALNQANQVRSDVENERTTLKNQSIAAGDPTLAATGALQSAAGLKRPSGFAPIGNLFSDFINTLSANRQANAIDTNVQPLFPSFGAPKKGSLSIV